MGCLNSKEQLPQRPAQRPPHSISFAAGAPQEKYITQQVLGKGAFGTVTLVQEKRDLSLMRAIKELKKSDLTSEDHLSFTREVEILSKLDHPNIMKIVEVYDSPSSYYIVTEYLSGGELLGKICKEKKLSEKLAAKYMHDMMVGLSYCHSVGIVHRDIKPQNLLLDSQDDNAAVKVIDFGLSGFKVQGRKFTQLMGTPLYMSPEMYQGSYDEKCDIWSSGVLLYMMITGFVPFYSKDISEIRHNVITQVVDFNSSVWQNVSKDCKDLIQKMLQKKPNNRPSAKQVLEHNWFNSYKKGEICDLPICEKAFENLCKFHAEDKLKRAILAYIATTMIDQDYLKELSDLFLRMDKNNDGRLSLEEVKNAYSSIGMKISDSEKMFKEIDSNSSGLIEYSEFLAASFANKNLENGKFLEQVFANYDVGGDGTLSVAELKAGFPGIECSKWCEFIKEADENKDGLIDLQEFKAYLLKN